MNQEDDLFKRDDRQLVDFRFDEEVVDVFADMIKRSVPGYDLLIPVLGMIAGKYLVEHTRVYDLGCSLGAATASIIEQSACPHITYVCIDNSPHMIERCHHNLIKIEGSHKVVMRCQDILQTVISDASVVVLNYTLQFVQPTKRHRLIKTIFEGLRPGGILFLSEKICYENTNEDTLIRDFHEAYKRVKGYSQLEIQRKREALENVLISESRLQHEKRLESAGFEQYTCWFSCLGFLSWLAIK